MTTVTINYKDISKKERTGTFEILSATGLSRDQKFDLITKNFVAVDFEDEDDYRAEKKAALVAGLEANEEFFVKIVSIK